MIFFLGSPIFGSNPEIPQITFFSGKLPNHSICLIAPFVEDVSYVNDKGPLFCESGLDLPSSYSTLSITSLDELDLHEAVKKEFLKEDPKDVKRMVALKSKHELDEFGLPKEDLLGKQDVDTSDSLEGM